MAIAQDYTDTADATTATSAPTASVSDVAVLGAFGGSVYLQATYPGYATPAVVATIVSSPQGSKFGLVTADTAVLYSFRVEGITGTVHLHFGP